MRENVDGRHGTILATELQSPISKVQKSTTCQNTVTFGELWLLVVRIDGKTQDPRSEIGEMDHINFSARGIEVLLLELNASKACGPDGLPNRLFQLCATSVAPYLKIIYDKSLEQSCLPVEWKVGSVVPIYKSGARSEVANYRPVSLTCVSCKILEHILYTTVVAHINKH